MKTEQAIRLDFREPIPVFPLPGCVLLPHATAPLHVFEPRYRQMLDDVLDSHGLIAMGLFEDDVDEEQYLHGQPSLRPIVCVGYCINYERLEDGGYYLLLQGLCRARIVEEIDHEPYRKFMLQPTEPRPLNNEQLAEHRTELEDALAHPRLETEEITQTLRQLLDEPEVPTAALIDLAIAGFSHTAEQRYAMLDEPNAHLRGLWLEEHLHRIIEGEAEAEEE